MATADFTASNLTTEQIERFWSYVARGGETDCWLWQRGRTRASYGMFHPVHGASLLTHRLSWALLRGPIPDGIEVCHDCPGGDNPACVNPAHLWLGSHGDNMRDAFAKGRMVERDANAMCRGSRHGMSTLVEADIIAMRATYAAGGVSMRALARRFHVTQANVSCIIARKTWKHVS